VIRKRGDERSFSDHVVRKGGAENIFGDYLSGYEEDVGKTFLH
jgi:hypothetical protein